MVETRLPPNSVSPMSRLAHFWDFVFGVAVLAAAPILVFIGCGFVAALLAGCVSSHPKLVSADAVPVYGTDPGYHTVYTGSDNQYHFFGWSRGLRGRVFSCGEARRPKMGGFRFG